MIRKRKVRFYQISYEGERYNQNGGSSEIGQWLKESFIKTCNEKMVLVGEQRRAIKLEDNYMIEVISCDDKLAFLKLGRFKDKDTVNLRNVETFETKEIPMVKDELLEVYTYCLIDFETSIISYMGVDGAPRYQVLERFFKALRNNEEPEIILTIIVPKEVYKVLMKKKTIGRCSAKVAVPCNEVLADFLCLPRDTFVKISNLKYTTIDLVIKSQRGKNLFNDRTSLTELIDKMLDKDGLKSFSFWANDDDEKSQVYDLLVPSIVKEISIDIPDGLENMPDPYETEIKKLYQKSKAELASLCRR